MQIKLSIFLGILFLFGCHKKENISNKKSIKMETVKTINLAAQDVKNSIKKNIVIAHRGSTYWTPEETEPAYRWARNIGADYLELDLQLTKDNKLVAFHDDDLKRTTNIKTIFPDRVNSNINSFTLDELRKLDVGSWFNTKNPDKARASFKNLKILTLKDVIKIAEGNRLIKNGNYFNYEKDPKDNGNRPGLYIETKHPKSNIENFLSTELTELGWNINKKTKTLQIEKGKVAIANSNARIILQSFSPKSILQLEKFLPNIPKCFLLWKPDMKGDLKTVYTKAIDFAVQNNVHIIGSSIAGKPNNYEELTAPWMAELIHKADLIIHPYTFDTTEQLKKYSKTVDGIFTNRADLALDFFHRKNEKTPQEILKLLDY